MGIETNQGGFRKLAFSTLGCPDWSLSRIIREALQNGYDSVELRGNGEEGEQADAHVTPSLTPRERSQIRTSFERVGIGILGVTAYSQFTPPVTEEQTANRRHLTSVVRLAQDLGAQYVRTFVGQLPQSGLLPDDGETTAHDGENANVKSATETTNAGPGTPRETLLPRIAASLSTVLRDTGDTDVSVLVETHDHWSAVQQALTIVNAVGDSRLGILWDIAHSLRAGDEPYQAARSVMPHLGYIHLKDEIIDGTGNVQPVVPGSGTVPITAVLDSLRKARFDGHLCFEWERKWHPEIPPLDQVLPVFRSWIEEG